MVAFLLGWISSLCVGLGGSQSSAAFERSHAKYCRTQPWCLGFEGVHNNILLDKWAIFPSLGLTAWRSSGAVSSGFCLSRSQQGVQQSTIRASSWHSEAVVLASSSALLSYSLKKLSNFECLEAEAGRSGVGDQSGYTIRPCLKPSQIKQMFEGRSL